MLRRLTVKGFKSLAHVEVSFPRLTVLFGPNAAGKSNLLEAIQALSRIGTNDTLAEAFANSIRGYPAEAFAFPPGGLPALLNRETARFSLQADLDVPKGERTLPYRYQVSVAIQPGSGTLTVASESLAALSSRGEPQGMPLIDRQDDQSIVRRTKKGKPRQVTWKFDHTLLADPRLGSDRYPGVVRCRQELRDWCIYYLDPRVAMRSARPPEELRDIGVRGEFIAPLLHRLCTTEPKRFAAFKRTLRALIPSVQDLAVDLDKRRGTLDIQLSQYGTQLSSRIMSEGTLRVLALCAIAANPWTGSLIAFEEPENGVHPRRLELIAQLLASLAIGQGRQIIVTTHSGLFCDAILKEARRYPDDIALLNVRRGVNGTEVHPLDVRGPLLTDRQIVQGLAAPAEDGRFESLVLRGLLDE